MTKVQLLTKELLPVLQNVISVVEKKHNIPILSHVLINLDQQKLTLTTTDSEIQVQVQTKIKCNESCHFTLYAKSLIDIIKNLEEKVVIYFTIEARKIKININKSSFELNSFNHSDFPLLNNQNPLLKGKNNAFKKISVDALDLKDLIDKTSFTIANQDIRAYLNGLYVEATHNELTLVSTDGYRLSIGSIKQLNSAIDKETAIIPKKSVSEIAKLLLNAKQTDSVDIQLSENYLKIHFKQTQIISQLINSNYPNYRQVIPSQSKELIKINRLEFLKTLRNIIPLVDENNKSVQLKLNKSEFDVLTHSERGSAKSSIAVDTAIKELLVNFNVHYLMGALDKLSTDIIHLVPPDENNESFLLVNQSDSNYQYVIMPIKV